ncbi:MAG: NfeD family protein, partial [Planctomycetota bacterium]
VFLSVPAFAFLAVRIWPLTPIGRRVILPAKEREEAQAEENSDEQLIGQIVETDSPLIPAGQIRILGKSRNAVARSGVIEAGQNVEIVGVKDFNLVVAVTTLPVTLSSRSPIVTPADDAPKAESGKEAEAKSSEAETILEAGNLLDLPAEELGLDDLD